LRAIVNLTNQFAHALAFVSFTARIPFCTISATLFGQLRINHLMHFAQVASAARAVAKLEEVGSLEFQRLESFLPVIGETVSSEPNEHSLQRPLNRSLAVRQTAQRRTARVVAMA
jgi:uncharacterized BrkB/YihY/UPF0761 family membrane protein